MCVYVCVCVCVCVRVCVRGHMYVYVEDRRWSFPVQWRIFGLLFSVYVWGGRGVGWGYFHVTFRFSAYVYMYACTHIHVHVCVCTYVCVLQCKCSYVLGTLWCVSKNIFCKRSMIAVASVPEKEFHQCEWCWWKVLTIEGLSSTQTMAAEKPVNWWELAHLQQSHSIWAHVMTCDILCIAVGQTALFSILKN